MKSALVCLAVLAVVGALPVRVKRGQIEHEEHSHGHATSYQNFNLESYHPVPVYKKHHESLHSYEAPSEHGHLSAALSLGDHEGGHEGYASLGEGSYHRSALTDASDHGDDAYVHAGAAAASEDAHEGYESHGSY